jgi:peptide/nickel transport system permease protein
MTQLVIEQPVVDRPTTVRWWRRSGTRPPYISIGILVGFVLIAVFGPMLIGSRATDFSMGDRLLKPVGFGGSWDHPFGTDKLGRDMFARTVVGARVALVVTLASILGGGLLGLVSGVVSGYFGGWRDSVISRMVDLSLAFPVVLLALLFAVQFGPSLWSVVVVTAILLWGRFARLARGESLALRQREYIVAARAMGVPPRTIVRTHIVPNIMGPMLILATLQVGWAILTEASLSFLGAGVPPPEPTWGSMVADGRDLLRSAWWVSTIPGLAIVAVTVACNIVGDWMHDSLDQHSEY